MPSSLRILICVLTCFLLFGLGASDLPAQRTGAADNSLWPFGVTPGSRGGFNRKDYWNLGILGGKASDAAKAPTSTTGRSGGRQVTRLKPAGKDVGPSRLKVEFVFPRGPLDKADIGTGDIIIGIDGKRFTDGSLDILAKALTKAESTKGIVTLMVEGPKREKTEKIKVKVKKQGKDFAKPLKGKARKAILRSATDWLAKKQSDDGGFPETLSGANGSVVQTALAGMAWMAAGSNLKKGKYRDNIDRAVKFIARTLDAPSRFERPAGGPSWDQTNWGYVHAILFFAELKNVSATGVVKQELKRMVAEVAKRQEKSGGWAHGPGGKNALDYLELNIMTALAISAFGSASKVKVPVDDNVIKKAMAYLEASSSGDGGVGYSDGPGQKGMGNIGRSAGSLLGVRNLGLARTSFGQKLTNYVTRNAGDVMGGHASLMQHIFLAGVAAESLGKTAAKNFWSLNLRDLTLARAPDGSFQPRPWHESLSMSSNSDVTFGEVWTTATWAIVLGCDPKANKGGGLPLWTGKKKAKR